MKDKENYTEDVRVRLPKNMSEDIEILCDLKCKKESEISREAIQLYLRAHRGEIEGHRPAFNSVANVTKKIVAAGVAKGGGKRGRSGPDSPGKP